MSLNRIRLKKGFTFSNNKGRISYIKTVLKSNLLEFLNDLKSVKNVYDLVITDFDPISAYAAKKYNIPCMGIGHQYSFYEDIPMTNKMRFSSMFFPKIYAPVTFSIPFHFHHFNQPILPPFIDPILHDRRDKEKIGDDVLVYLPWENLNEMIAILEKVSRDFIFYTDVEHIKEIENITLKPFSNKNFKYDLLRCRCLITNAGFQLTSEALFLGKPILCKPQKGQPEQEHNAKILDDLGYATVSQEINAATIKDWLHSCNNIKIDFSNPIDVIVDIIENREKDFSNEINRLWQIEKIY